MLSCKLCTYTAKQLHQHIRVVHKMTSIEYRNIYGSSEIMQIGFNPLNKIKNRKIIDNGYDKINSILNSIDILYSPEETRLLLSNNDFYKTLYGKAKNRTLIKLNPKLYKSILYHTNVLNNLNVYGISGFTRRLEFIVHFNYNLDLLKCNCGKSYTFNKRCRYCPLPRLEFRPHKQESKQKIRLSTIKYLSNIKGQLAPRYNKNSIPIIEQYGKENGYNFQHAENGGEFYISDLGYWVDAYDVKNNIVLEIDEKHHFMKNGEYTLKDKIRQDEIEKYLGCKFIRIPYA